LDSRSGKLSIWRVIDEVSPSSTNPFGIRAIEYDIDNNRLWVSAIDRSDYHHQRGRLYLIDIESREILQRFEGYDILSLKMVKTDRGRYLLGGSARENIIYAFRIRWSRSHRGRCQRAYKAI